VLRQLQ